MIRTLRSVIRGEGLLSAIRRATDRPPRFSGHAEILNVASTRYGGLAIQLWNRLREEQKLREVALVDFEQASGPAIHLEGTHDIPVERVLRLIDAGVRVIVSVHDFSLISAQPHSFSTYDPDRRRLGRALLTAATSVIFPSAFLADKHRSLFDLPELAYQVIEPGVPAAPRLANERTAIAYAGSVQRHKGSHLLPEIVRGAECHVFGGGDEELLRELRRHRNIKIHGYYRAGQLPSLLARHNVGLVILPSIVPESYSLTLSEAWQAGAAAAAFDHGALAARIRRTGGGWVAPLDSGAGGLAEIVAARTTIEVPREVASSEDAARAHVALYRSLPLAPRQR